MHSEIQIDPTSCDDLFQCKISFLNVLKGLMIECFIFILFFFLFSTPSQKGALASGIEKGELLKIRRLLLMRLWAGWRAETRSLHNHRYKAAQIIARMVRRTKGPLWVKEAVLVCYHMWYRYIKVKVMLFTLLFNALCVKVILHCTLPLCTQVDVAHFCHIIRFLWN